VAKEFGGKACPANFEELHHLASQVLQRRYNGHSNSKDAIVCSHGELEYRFTLLTKQCVLHKADVAHAVVKHSQLTFYEDLWSTKCSFVTIDVTHIVTFHVH
jgi:hypothetical protein